ncbi:MAG: hypothetical protein CM15mP21_5460 [Hyphomicrobiales bacterium]|nr:MAG: hypothetical protein CM15mP21_5460 [Hyphomicrobiales bacterium]
MASDAHLPARHYRARCRKRHLALRFAWKGKTSMAAWFGSMGCRGNSGGALTIPKAVNIMLGEAVVLAAMLGTMLKFDGRFILQLHGGARLTRLWPIKVRRGLRGFAQFKPSNCTRALSLGKPHRAFGR